MELIVIFYTIFQSIIDICKQHPEILIFLSLAIGYYVGKIKCFGFNLDSTASTLLAALILGQANVEITPLLQTVAFSIFIFVVGYKVGPNFFGSLKKSGSHYLILSIFFALTGLITAIILGKLFGFDKGTTAGLLSGSLTQSSIMGTAQESIKTLSISYAQKTTLISNVAIAHAVTYIFGFAGVILFYKLIPGLLRINLKKEAKQLETQFKKHTKIVTPKPKTNNSYIIMIGAGCALGIILGLAVINIGVIPLTLGMGGGVLLSGLFFGWLQSAHPFFEPIGKEAQRLLTTGSLNLFIACVGLSVGPRAVTALQTHGLSLFFAGIILALTPHVLGIIFGRLILKLDYVLLLGALTGAGTITPSLQVLKNEAESTAPALGYTVTYALGNFILTLLGTLVIHFM